MQLQGQHQVWLPGPDKLSIGEADQAGNRHLVGITRGGGTERGGQGLSMLTSASLQHVLLGCGAWKTLVAALRDCCMFAVLCHAVHTRTTATILG